MENNWKIKKLGEVCDVFTDGNWIESKDQSLEGIRLIQTGNIGFGFFKNRNEKARYISEDTFKRLKCTEIFQGDCLISRLPDPVGRACIIPNTGEKMITAVDCSILRFKSPKMLPIFFNYYSQSNTYLNDVEQKTTGTTRKRISRKNLGFIKIPTPPLPEQHRIIKILDKTFSEIEKAKTNAGKNLKNAKEIFNSYLENVFANPGDKWEEKKLGEIYDVRDGTHDSPKYQKDGYLLITSKNLKGGFNTRNAKFITEKDYKKINKRSKVDKGDLLFAMIGTIGTPTVIKEQPDFAIKNVALFKVPKNQSNYFLKYYLDSPFVIEKMQREAKGTTQKFVGLGYLRNFKILIPSFYKQKFIVAKLDTLSKETKDLETIYQKKINNLEELKKSILNKAFNGEL